MTKEELAGILNGREYGNETKSNEAEIAKENGLVIVYGASDDLMEFEGAIYDEIGCHDGGSAYLSAEGEIIKEEELKFYKKKSIPFFQIDAVWCPKNENGEIICSWIIDAESIETAGFEIFEDGELYCKGIVFDLKSLSKTE